MGQSIWRYQLKITLIGIRPLIWRRVLIDSDVDLGALHRFIQEVMGWRDRHLHQFIHRATVYQHLGEARMYGFGCPVEDERSVQLDSLLTAPHQCLIYDYDLNANWEHEICLEARLLGGGAKIPQCVAQQGEIPDEDCRGVEGYYYLHHEMSR